MPRLSYSDLVNQVQEQVSAAGGEISHTDLMNQIDTAAARQLTSMVNRGDINARVVAVPDAPASVMYYLPGSAPVTLPATSGGDA